MGEEEGSVYRVPIEFDNWINKIIQEFEKTRGFRPSKADILRNILKQFEGKFIV
jgi:hypothetical protein